MGIREILKNEIDNWVSEACEKQIEEKPKDIKRRTFYDDNVITERRGKCPICDLEVSESYSYCPFCGQKLDWGKPNEID